MTDTSNPSFKQPLGVGKIISESFSLLFNNIVAVAVAAFIPVLFSLVLSGSLVGYDIVFGTAEPDVVAQNLGFAFFVNAIVSMAIYGIITAILVQLAYDAKAGRGTQFARYANTAIQTLIPNVLLTFAFSIMLTFGFLALIVPGLWIYGVFSVTIPALVIERVGFGALSRSAQLTKEYRWPVIGTLIIMWIAAGILNYIPVSLATWMFSSLGGLATVITVVVASLLYTVTYGLISISISLIYARLREIKEGVGVDDLVSVFE